MARLLTLNPAGRRRWFLIWQAPVLFLVALLTLALAITAPGLLTTPSTLAGAAALALGAAIALPLPVRFLAVVPVLDIVAIAVIRSQDVGTLISISSIALIPILCLGFHFGRSGVALASCGAVLITALPYLRASEAPHATQWIGLLALPTVSVMLALVAQLGSSILADRSEKLSRAFARSSEQLEITRSLIEVLPVGLAYHGPDGERRLANRRAFEFALLAGMDVENPDRPGTSVWREDRIRRVPPEEQFVTRALSGAEIEAELVWLGEPGSQAAVAVSAHQVTSAAGDPLGTVVVSLDVTELVESVRVRDQFLATLSHELRTPLVSVVGYLDIISEELEGGDPELVEMLGTARRGARTLTDRISHLLVAGSQDRLTLDLDRVDLSELVGTVAERHRHSAGTRGVQLSCDLPPVVTTADPHKIELVVDNLVSNAVKHTAMGGSVEISLRSGPQIMLMVGDTGSGLARHERERAFDRFYRTDSARRDAVQGLGLGLSICKAVVEAHGGEISMVTSPGQGTTVTVVLPALTG
ncbi:PAS fold-containing protein [Nocardioides lianchengensis]|uniref:Sensor-like histidine kinase SenX3 n=1 Tax=Nocardioides lianchengensis TaxID=1045774 RepID=A0A1G6XPG6_9ACTN|nr:signal transduction histidine kinase [Nocardioides lianchengensis]SDD80109.1 PAS fold-containing protein [Nocardioides lianchengensis]